MAKETLEEVKEMTLVKIESLSKIARALNDAYGLSKLKKVIEILDEIYADVDNALIKDQEN